VDLVLNFTPGLIAGLFLGHRLGMFRQHSCTHKRPESCARSATFHRAVLASLTMCISRFPSQPIGPDASEEAFSQRQR